jgi:hypothetical protein
LILFFSISIWFFFFTLDLEKLNYFLYF